MPLMMPPQTPPAAIMMSDVKDHKHYMLMGFIAFGPDSSLTKLEAAAKAAGISAAPRVTGTEQIDHTMIVFRPGSDMAAAREFYHKAKSGGFGFLMIEVMVVTPEDAKDGITSADIRKKQPEAVTED